MSRKPLLLVVTIAFAFSAALTGGCHKKATSNNTSNASAATTETAEASASASATGTATPTETGAIEKPAAGSALRTSLLNAARTYFNTTSEFRIKQLWAQGNTAVGELEQVTGGTGSVFLAWMGPTWSVIWTAPASSAGATKAGAAAALPTFSAELLAKMTWPAAQTSQTTPTTSEDEKTVLAKLDTAAKSWAETAMSGKGKPYEILISKVAQDSSGNWWGVAYVQPTADGSNSYEGMEFWCKYAGGKWTGQLQDPEPPNPANFFPAAVVEKLEL